MQDYSCLTSHGAQPLKIWKIGSRILKGSAVKFLVSFANKSDLPNRDIAEDELTAWASDKGVEIFETSAKTGMNVDRVFELIAKTCVKSYDSSPQR